jgi:hypothetical protein
MFRTNTATETSSIPLGVKTQLGWISASCKAQHDANDALYIALLDRKALRPAEERKLHSILFPQEVRL